MKRFSTTRRASAWQRQLPALGLLLAGGFGFAQNRGPAPIVRQPPMMQQRAPMNQQRAFGPGQQNRPHLSEWMQSHSNLPLAQQQRALEMEPGFRQLQPDQQARMHERLTQLNGMTPEQRQRTIARTEAMERLNPDQRQQVRSASQQLGSLPPDRRMAVARAYRSLQNMPEPQRQSYLNSPQIRGQFNDQERGTLNNLLAVPPNLLLQPRRVAPYPATPYPQPYGPPQ
ncbi:DUF3106 domain-containing protein [Granulicella tundricola]|uniref:DUF3106 domain-containing protein n=1 Tax=Granulicella tundricola (strain ATCC BAA-1859 / DSM 23138 / MP5ACTX9) TaxID=1198114 RepID=E8WWE6_GRATM|nr:DUF3106 domain-containing protein [Granulicella tundricola]ADW69610.1 hypothetical protein AciX9_2585 [Granulicella tundricola MP5ACTX9]